MTKIKEKKTKEDMYSHIVTAKEFIDTHLPHNYVDEVHKVLGKNDVSSGIIRNIKNMSSDKITDNRLPVLNALVEVAKKNKAEKDRLIESFK